MCITILDTEATIFPSKIWQEGADLLKGGNPSPHIADNRLVTIQYKKEYGKIYTLKFTEDNRDSNNKNWLTFQQVLEQTTLLVGFNLKFDLGWLQATKFKYTGKIWDCQLVEYVMNQPNLIMPSLNEVCTSYGLEQKIDVVKEQYWKKGINTDKIPFEVLKEYGEKDIELTEQIFNSQYSEFNAIGYTPNLINTKNLTNDFCPVLTDIEFNGLQIDENALYKLEKETIARHEQLRIELQDIIYKVMGDTPISLDSPEQCSMLFYSRKVKDKHMWANVFNFKTNQNKFERINGLRRIPDKAFNHIVKLNTDIIYRTNALKCWVCAGIGKKQGYKKDGTNRKNLTKCPECNGIGYIYENTPTIAGLRITPSKMSTTANGFSTSSDAIDSVLEKAKLSKIAKEFVEKYSEYNALSTYLSTYIEGIKNLLTDGRIHPNLNQTATATGRLSSSLHSIPRGNTFPLKRVFKSRFDGGWILDADMGSLEFRVAAEMSGCQKALEDIIAGVDIHRISASKIFNIKEEDVTDEQRQTAKPSTFAPLYGASKDWGLMERYPGIGKWHKNLINSAIQTKKIVLPTGRTYNFPTVRRTEYGCTGQTKIKNYPVQGFATADVVPAILIELYNRLRGFKSKLIFTIHDSILIDIHPEEKDKIIEITRLTLSSATDIIKNRYNIDLKVPLKADIKIGRNALDTVKI